MAGKLRNLQVVAIFVLSSFAMVATGYDFDTTRSSDAYGRRFIVVLPVEDDLTIRMIHNIFMSTRSREVVQVNISRPNTTWTKPNIAIQPGIIANITLDMLDTRSPLRTPYNPNGIPIQIDAAADIGVWVVPGRGDSVLGGYRAIPVDALAKHYVTVLYPSPEYISEVVLYSPNDESNEIQMHFQNADMMITIDNVTKTVHTSGQDVVKTFTIPKMDSAKIVSWSDLSGLKLSASTGPVSVTSSRNCSTAPQACNDLMEHAAPLGSWGQSFVIVPQVTNGPSILKLRILTAFLHLNTTVSIYNSSGVLKENWTMDTDMVYKDIDVTAGRLLTIRATTPIMVTQFFTDKQRRLDYAAMVTLPPVEQFTNQTVVFPAQDHHVFNNTLVVITRCEHRRDILLDNKDISNNYSTRVRFHQVQNSSVHGTYCVFNTTLKYMSHSLKLRSNSNIGAAYSAILYGAGTKEAYAYPVAADLQEIVCGVDGGHISPCEFYVPPDYTTPSTNGTVTEHSGDPPKEKKGPDHTIAIVIVLVILSSLAIIIIVVVVLGSCGKDKGPRVAWRRLHNTSEIHYDIPSDDDNMEVDV